MGHRLGTVDPTARNNSPVISLKIKINTDLYLDKTSFRGNKVNKEIAPNICKRYHI